MYSFLRTWYKKNTYPVKIGRELCELNGTIISMLPALL
jgi:hypothetical protein